MRPFLGTNSLLYICLSFQALARDSRSELKMNRGKCSFKDAVVLCICILFSSQTYGAGKWRERFFRLLPFIAPKAYKLEKREKARLDKMVTSLSDRELVVLDLELNRQADGIGTVEKMAQAAKKEIHRRIFQNAQNGQNKILEASLPPLTTWLGNILNNEETAPQFFEFFQNAAGSDLSEKYRGILHDFILANREKIMALNPTPKQLQGVMKAIRSIDASIKILQETLDEGKSADEFFSIFNTLAWDSPADFYRSALNKFFQDNAEALGKLSFSPRQAERIARYTKSGPTEIVLLKGALKQAQGDADKFFAIFDTLAWGPPADFYRRALNEFFQDNAEALGELSFSPRQVERIARYTKSGPTEIVLLKGALKQAKGDADKFFAIFDTLAWGPPADFYRRALNEFFQDNAEALGELSFSPDRSSA